MKLSAIEKINYDNCTGCYGCLNICPIHGAIEFKLTEDGFYKPFITDKCIHCGICQKVCPIINKKNENKKEEIEVYACWSKDKEILKNSSSGGVFSELAKIYLEKGDIVFGAKWEEGEIVHSYIENIKELSKLQKSKYFQSKVNFSYKKVQEFLNKGKKVLFVGTPCEIATLKNLISDENLVTVEFICHGIPSYKSYRKYIKENFNINYKELEIDFRNKETGWNKFNLTYKKENKIIKKIYHKEDIWFLGFLRNIYLNKSCYDCKFRTLPRTADITLGDFWGVPEELKNIDGTSVVTLNNSKGKELFEKVKEKIVYKKTTFEIAHKGNPCLYNYRFNDKEREKFFKDFYNYSFIELHKKYFPYPSLIKKIFSLFRNSLGFIKRRTIKLIRGTSL